MMVAMKDDSGTYYFAKTPAERPFDHLSSASLVMDSSGGVITNQRFMQRILDLLGRIVGP